MLYLCATPIGNLKDITLRAVEALSACDAVFCEDTRQTAKLLNHLNIKKPLISCHEHNERFRAEELTRRLKEGETVCYCSDAGMPCISDPGAELVRVCIENGLDFTVLPGASAAITAVALSGLAPQPFTFFGFLPRESAKRRRMLDDIANTSHLCLLYESPHRVLTTLEQLKERLGAETEAAVLRELTKRFESVYRGRLGELAALLPADLKGECVIAVLPGAETAKAGEGELDSMLTQLLKTCPVRDAATAAAEALALPKKRCYARALELSNEE
ncbi:MAG: 16S rRNA (cytidine(1402)-2'-O)-methyltransferase [Clostridia bacterium]|nr:16S rRNA (cytidine(1402)-2'-O)-methyltransferase [Clostridia bacterium]